MKLHKHHNNFVHWYMTEVQCRLVAKTGIVSDRFHLGKLILSSFKEAPDHVMQIDGGTGESITFKTALEKSVSCATAFRDLGLKINDVIIIMAPNHNDISLPVYGALYLGVTVCGADATLGVMELKDTFRTIKPNMIFCQNEKTGDVEDALGQINLDADIITFDESKSHLSFSKLLETYGGDNAVEIFECENFDPEETIGMLSATSGSTGASKYPALTHKCIAISLPYICSLFSKFPEPFKNAIILSPVQWLSAWCHLIMSPIVRYTRVQTSAPLTIDHIFYLINTYRPSFAMVSPTLISLFIKPENRNKCDLTCFEVLLVGGFAVHQKYLDAVKELAPDIDVRICYGMSEIGGFTLSCVADIPGSCGKPLGHFHYRLVDPTTNEDILEPNKPGELWVKSPLPFKGYYNDPQTTAEIMAEDGWLKTGDILYRDVNWNFFFVDRLKMILKYCSYHISPTELEDVIIQHPGVQQVAVTGIPDDKLGDLPVACVVTHDNYPVTAQEIKDMVKQNLVDSKQLRGGVIFMKELPMTSTLKLNRNVLKQLVIDMKRE